MIAADTFCINTAPICLCKWMPTDEISDDRLQRVVQECTGKALVYPLLPRSADDFLHGMTRWLEGNPNAQYLYVVSHGIRDQADGAVGIGRTGDAGEHVTWNQLWDTVVSPYASPPKIYSLGCHTEDAVAVWDPLLTPQIDDSFYFVGLDQEVTRRGMVLVKRMLARLLQLVRQTVPVIYPEEEIARIQEVWPAAHMYYPYLLADQPTRFVSVSDFERLTGLALPTYQILLATQRQPPFPPGTQLSFP